MLVGMLLLVVGSVLQPVGARASEVSQSSSVAGHVDVAVFKLPITPISAQYFDRVLKAAEEDGAVAVVFQIDTPGGLVDSMQEIVKRTLASKVPVVMYISPRGAQSASAGVFLVYAAHVAAMAPQTRIGSAEVLLNAGNDQGSGTPESGDQAALRRKVTNDLVSLIRELATHRGRDPDFGEQAVRQSKNLGADEALKVKVVDVIASSVPELLDKIDGRKVDVDGEQVTLKTKDAPTNQVPMTWVEQILLVITDPSVAFVLISLGTLGITWEFINPGAVFPGVIGAIMLLVGFLALGTLPINAAGLAFMILAFVLFIADVFMPTHGILTAGGIASLVMGGLLLVNTTNAPGLPGVSPYTVAGVAAGLGGFFFFAVYKVFQARRMRPTTGREGFLGQMAETRTELAPEGMVFLNGELWRAVSTEGPVPAGRTVRVVGAEGLMLSVKPET
jgi:membrane-bound serine protease (ClpP class)